ncbi:MAG TPA: DUF3048 domain-containing protein [Candidatus Acidoferrales bacterium]|nr:DUF3048 domain-containing protein [Candidatus Acidoferrales bacterium]
MTNRAPAWLLRIRSAVMRRPKTFALLTVVLVACSAAVPTAVSPSPLESLITLAPTPSPSPSPTPRPLVKARSVSVAGDTVIASGDFRGNNTTQLARIADPTGEAALRIAVADRFDAEPVAWFDADRNFLALQRAKFAVADVDFDGKDDLVALYNSGENTSKLFVFRSTGQGFAFGGVWWSGALDWSRGRQLLAGKFSASGHDTLLVPFQDDGSRMRILAFDSNGKSFTDPMNAYDSGKGQFDLGTTRFAVGHFTRSGGADQLLAMRQSDKKATVRVLDATANGFALGIDLVSDAEVDVTHATLGAADVLGTGHDELVSLYTDAQGGARVHVFDLSAAPVSFLTPLKGWDGWATLPAGTVCGGPGVLALGDWDTDGRADAAAIAPARATTFAPIRATSLMSTGTSFNVATGGPTTLGCPVWPLTGMPLGFGDATQRPVYVKTDNNPSARPHYGISKADIVYEWLVEGLTTRLAAVYQSQRPDVIGSVRSVRMTDRHVLPSLDAVLVYSGGGPEELMAINYDASVAHRYVDLSPNYGWGYRVPFREGPYNYFTTWANVKAAIAAAPDGEQPATVAPWPFLPTASADPQVGGFGTGLAATSITIPYRALFGVQYKYDATSRSYARYDDGVREVDGANNQAIAAKNIVVIQTEVHFTTAFGLDPAGNPKLEEVLTGTGKAVVFRDGLRVDATWTRDDVVDSFILKDSKGAVIELEPGQTWVHVVPSDWTIPSQ